MMAQLELTEEEQLIINQMIQNIRADPSISPAITDSMVVQALLARKFEEDRATELLRNCMYIENLP